MACLLQNEEERDSAKPATSQTAMHWHAHTPRSSASMNGCQSLSPPTFSSPKRDLILFNSLSLSAAAAASLASPSALSLSTASFPSKAYIAVLEGSTLLHRARGFSVGSSIRCLRMFHDFTLHELISALAPSLHRSQTHSVHGIDGFNGFNGLGFHGLTVALASSSAASRSDRTPSSSACTPILSLLCARSIFSFSLTHISINNFFS